MKRIGLTRGMFALVDDDDFEWLSQWTWYAQRGCQTWYAARRDGSGTVLMHRELLRDEVGTIDHKNGNGLDNQKHNIRSATARQNAQNRTKWKVGPLTKYKGISWTSQGWRARIAAGELRADGTSKQIHLGFFASEIEAARAYDAASWVYFGDYGFRNFPDEEAQ